MKSIETAHNKKSSNYVESTIWARIMEINNEVSEILNNESYTNLLYLLGNESLTAMDLCRKIAGTPYEKERSVISRQMEKMSVLGIVNKIDSENKTEEQKDISFKGNKKLYNINFNKIIEVLLIEIAWRLEINLDRGNIEDKNQMGLIKNFLNEENKDKFIKNKVNYLLVKGIIETGNKIILENMKNKEKQELFTIGTYLDKFILRQNIQSIILNSMKQKMPKIEGVSINKDFIEYMKFFAPILFELYPTEFEINKFFTKVKYNISYPKV